jgi:hypothetical protein
VPSNVADPLSVNGHEAVPWLVPVPDAVQVTTEPANVPLAVPVMIMDVKHLAVNVPVPTDPEIDVTVQ